MKPQTRYTRSGEVYIGYQAFGDGAIDPDGKVGGVAVHIGARVAASADPGEVRVSSTVKDLVAGSGLEFEDRGTHELKGIAGDWRLYAVSRPA